MVGPVFFLVMVQLVFWLIAINGSTLLPGDWGSFSTLMGVYLVLNGISIGIFAQGVAVPLILEGNSGRFLKVFSLAASLAWVVTILFLKYGYKIAPSPVPGLVRLQDLVFYGLFVGPSEELLFRVVLPPLISKSYAWQLILSSLAFAGFHIGAYTANGISWTWPTLVSQLMFAAIIGAVFYLIAWKSVDKNGIGQPRAGYAGSAGAHVGYDLTVTGVIGGLGIAARTLGLVAL